MQTPTLELLQKYRSSGGGLKGVVK